MVTQRSLILVEAVTIRTSYRVSLLVLVPHMPGDGSFVNPFFAIQALNFGAIYNIK